MSRSAKTNRARIAHKIGRELRGCYNSHLSFSVRKPPENAYASARDHEQACLGDMTGKSRLEQKLGGRRYGYVQRAYRADLKVKMRKIERSKRKEAVNVEVREAALIGRGGYR